MDDEIDPDATEIKALVQEYFLGVYEGDVERLRQIFNPQCWLFGQNSNGSHEFPLSGFLDQIASEQVPKTEGEPFDMHLVLIEKTGPIGIAKVDVRYQSRRYTDFLTLHKTAAGWKVVNKVFFCAD